MLVSPSTLLGELGGGFQLCKEEASLQFIEMNALTAIKLDHVRVEYSAKATNKGLPTRRGISNKP